MTLILYGLVALDPSVVPFPFVIVIVSLCEVC